MTYTTAALVGVASTVALELVVLRTGLLRRRLFWASYAVIVIFQLATNGVLTGRDIVRYDDDVIVGLRFVNAPVEDLLFGFALVTQTLLWWVWLGRRAARDG
ncbi:MAG TPA: lycopene cyclase domain-containing protein [Mycobacteriales bacterium]|nr:lycopene cyclase domain-containing protein [Mycobacteriales bacterium]